MKKKKQNPATEPAAAAVSAVVSDLKTLIRDHATFFDSLVDLIPARYYLPTDNLDKPWFQGLPKDAKEAAKRQSKENTKKSRRERLDPEKAASKTTNQILKESLESEKSENQSAQGVNGGDGRSSSVTIEELHQRLRKRIEELRAGRGGGGERREKNEGRKRKRNEEREKKDDSEGRRENERDVIEKEVSEAAKDIEFGKVKLRAGIDDGSINKKKKKKRKLSKEEELERALKLEEAKKDPEKGDMVAKKHSWKAATERAMGIKVHDNPKLLKKGLQKEKKKHKKSVEKWKQRAETTEKMKQDKQDKRKGNIKAKIDRKKQMKIEKREKKLMRPGFEGRKEGFVNGN